MIDGNLREPGIATLLGLPASPGLVDFLGGDATLDETIQETGQDCLAAITAGVLRSVKTVRLSDRRPHCFLSEL